MSHPSGDTWSMGKFDHSFDIASRISHFLTKDFLGPASPPRHTERDARDDLRHRELDSRDSRDRYSRSDDRDRGHERERGGGSSSGGRDRDRDRDRRERDEYRRERDRERERDRRSRGGDRQRDGRDHRDIGSRRREHDRDDRDGSKSSRYGSGGSGNGGRLPRRSQSPEPRHRRSHGPTEDLTDVISIDKRQRIKTLWDVKPAGYENVTTEMAKLSGLFPLPGAPRPIDYTKLQGLVPNLPGGSDGSNHFAGGPNSGNPFLSAPGNSLKLESSRSAKRVLISGFEAGSYTHTEIANYFNEAFKSLELENPLPDTTPAVLESFLGENGALAVLQLQTSEIATIAMAFNGSYFQDDDSKFIIHTRRPADYITPIVSALDIATAAAAAGKVDEEKTDTPGYKSKVLDSGKKISIAGIPSYLNESQIVEVLNAFGPLAGFQLIKDKHTKESRGIAFCEFQDNEVTTMACGGLNGMELGDGILRVSMASKGLDVDESAIPFGAADGMSSLVATINNNNQLNSRQEINTLTNTPVLQLLNMVTPEELVDTAEYKEIEEDIREECAKYGKVVSMVIPRPDPKYITSKRLTIQVGAAKRQDIKVVPGVGKVFIKFDTHEACKRAHVALGGRKFSDRTVISSFFSEENFDLGIF